jgi:hypothetical protein
MRNLVYNRSRLVSLKRMKKIKWNDSYPETDSIGNKNWEN